MGELRGVDLQPLRHWVALVYSGTIYCLLVDRPSRLSQDENRLLEDYYVVYYRMPRHNTVMRDVETPYELRFMVLHMREIY